MIAFPILNQLCELSTEMRRLSQILNREAERLDGEGLGFIRDTAVELEDLMHHLTRGGHLVDPLESRKLRHDLRNKIAVIKGFAELMQMDVEEGDEVGEVLGRLMDSAEEFICGLDKVKGEGAAVEVMSFG